MNLTIDKVLSNDYDGILIEEETLEIYLMATGVRPDFYDTDDVIDSTVTCDFAADIGLTNLGDFGQGLLFGNKSDLFKTDERFFTFLTRIEADKGE